jgi:hypothetical protein
MKNEISKEDFIAEERAREYADEVRDGFYHSWLSDNITDLREDFIKDNKAEFNEMLEKEIIDEDRDIDYWKEVFCNEEMEQDFIDFCKERYGEYRDCD